MSKKAHRKATHFKSADAHHQALTIYNSGFGVVQETRSLTVGAGKNEIQLEGMPQHYIPNSILVLSVDEGVTLGGVSYQQANFNGQRLLAALEGSEIEVKFRSSNGRQRSCSGTLQHFLGDKILLEKADGRNALINTNDIEEVGFEGELPDGLSKKPSLVINADSTSSGPVKARILYRSAGFNWSATHTAVFDEKKGEIARFESWASVTNGSGAAFHDAALTLLAGNVQPQADAYGGREVFAMAAAAPMGGGRAKVRQANAESVGEQKTYVVAEPITLAEGENKQIPLFAADHVPVKREYFLPAQPLYLRAQGGNEQLVPVSIRLKLKNDVESKLGAALAAGEVNIYELDSRGDVQLTASDNIDHIATGETFGLLMGSSTDIKAERKLVESVQEGAGDEGEGHLPIRPLGGPNVGLPGVGAPDLARRGAVQPTDEDETPKFRVETWEVTVHNFKKDKAVEVSVMEEFPDDSTVVETTHEFKKERANRFCANLKVPSADKVTLRYQLRIKEA